MTTELELCSSNIHLLLIVAIVACISVYFFIEIIDREEISIYKLYGLTNLKIITSLSLMTFLIGTFILIFFYHISSNLKLNPTFSLILLIKSSEVWKLLLSFHLCEEFIKKA